MNSTINPSPSASDLSEPSPGEAGAPGQFTRTRVHEGGSLHFAGPGRPHASRAAAFIAGRPVASGQAAFEVSGAALEADPAA
jgi:hypothetical protein